MRLAASLAVLAALLQALSFAFGDEPPAPVPYVVFLPPVGVVEKPAPTPVADPLPKASVLDDPGPAPAETKTEAEITKPPRVPEFLGEPTPVLRSILAAHVALRAGDTQEAARRAAEAEELRPHVAGLAAGAPFDDFRDADDLHAGFLEVLTTTGKYFWIPTERVASIEFHPPRRARDLAWRRASISVTGGPDGDVYLPAIYDTNKPDISDEFLLGRATDWIGPEEGPMVGIGQRVFLMGEDATGIMDLTALRFGQ